MNYITQLNAFDEWAIVNQPATGQYALYIALLAINNKCGWKEWFAAPNMIIDGRIAMTKQGITKARQYLSDNGLIEFKTRSGNQATMYKIIPMGQIVVAPVVSNESNGQIVVAPVVAELSHQLSIPKQETKTETKSSYRAVLVYQNAFGIASSTMVQYLMDDVDTYGDEWVCDAIEEAVINGVKNYKYVRTILERWSRDGRGSSKVAKTGQAARQGPNYVMREFTDEELQNLPRG